MIAFTRALLEGLGTKAQIRNTGLFYLASAGPSVGRLRFLGGVQIDLWHLKAFVQGNLMPDKAAGVAFGVRGDI